jgi:hypothetical protein
MSVLRRVVPAAATEVRRLVGPVLGLVSPAAKQCRLLLVGGRASRRLLFAGGGSERWAALGPHTPARPSVSPASSPDSPASRSAPLSESAGAGAAENRSLAVGRVDVDRPVLAEAPREPRIVDVKDGAVVAVFAADPHSGLAFVLARGYVDRADAERFTDPTAKPRGVDPSAQATDLWRRRASCVSCSLAISAAKP